MASQIDLGDCGVQVLADTLGMTTTRVYQLGSSGVFEIERGKVDLASSIHRYFGHLKLTIKGRGVASKDSGVDPIAAGARLSRERYLLQDQKNRAKRASLVPADAIEAALGAVVTVAGNRLETLAGILQSIVLDAGHPKREAAAVAADVRDIFGQLQRDAPTALRRVRSDALNNEIE